MLVATLTEANVAAAATCGAAVLAWRHVCLWGSEWAQMTAAVDAP